MNNIPSSSPRAVPSIHILDADDTSALFEGEMFPPEMYNILSMVSDDMGYPCSRDLQSEYNPSNSFCNPSSELDDIPELSHLTTTTSQLYLTGQAYSLPHSPIVQENGTASFGDGGLSPSSFGSSAPSPTSSFTGSLSPSSFYDPLGLSDSESAVSPSPATPDGQFHWPPQRFDNQSNDSLVLPPAFLGAFNDIHPPRSIGYAAHRRSRSSPSARREPVASKAMLEANSRRRRHPPQFECPECQQTFTALFSLKRHQQSHSGERPFHCSVPGCKQRFFNSSDCKRHEKSKKRHKDLEAQ